MSQFTHCSASKQARPPIAQEAQPALAARIPALRAEIDEIQAIDISTHEIVLRNDAIIPKPTTLIDPTSAEVIVIRSRALFSSGEYQG